MKLDLHSKHSNVNFTLHTYNFLFAYHNYSTMDATMYVTHNVNIIVAHH